MLRCGEVRGSPNEGFISNNAVPEVMVVSCSGGHNLDMENIRGYLILIKLN